MPACDKFNAHSCGHFSRQVWERDNYYSVDALAKIHIFICQRYNKNNNLTKSHYPTKIEKFSSLFIFFCSTDFSFWLVEWMNEWMNERENIIITFMNIDMVITSHFHRLHKQFRFAQSRARLIWHGIYSLLLFEMFSLSHLISRLLLMWSNYHNNLDIFFNLSLSHSHWIIKFWH